MRPCACLASVRPRVILVPLVSTLLLIAACLLGVIYGSNLAASTAWVDAQRLGESTMNSFALKIALSTPPLRAASSAVRQNANWTQMEPYLTSFLKDQLTYWTNISLVQIDPQFIGGIELPAGLADSNKGNNFLLHPTPQRNLAALRNWPNDAVLGPFSFAYGGWGVNVKHLIYVSKDVNLSAMGLPYNLAIANCTLCNTVNPAEALWGVCSSNIDLQPLRDGTDPTFQKLSEKYSWVLWETGQFSPLLNASVPRYNIASYPNGSTHIDDALTIEFQLIEGNTWFLDMAPTLGWQPAWRLPLLIVLPFVCVLVGLVLLAREIVSIKLEMANQRNEALLYRMLPPSVAGKLRKGQRAEATDHPDVTILFSDIVGFTDMSALSSPIEVCDMLNLLYVEFDDLLNDFPCVYKVETIGDAYMLVANITTPTDDHVDQVIKFAVCMLNAASTVKSTLGQPLQIRVGIHTGPVVASVIGSAMPRFTLFGDTVNTASRMESHGVPGKIHISSAAFERIRNKPDYEIADRGQIEVKGKGVMKTYLISGCSSSCPLTRPPAAVMRPVEEEGRSDREGHAHRARIIDERSMVFLDARPSTSGPLSDAMLGVFPPRSSFNSPSWQQKSFQALFASAGSIAGSNRNRVSGDGGGNSGSGGEGGGAGRGGGERGRGGGGGGHGGGRRGHSSSLPQVAVPNRSVLSMLALMQGGGSVGGGGSGSGGGSGTPAVASGSFASRDELRRSMGSKPGYGIAEPPLRALDRPISERHRVSERPALARPASERPTP